MAIMFFRGRLASHFPSNGAARFKKSFARFHSRHLSSSSADRHPIPTLIHPRRLWRLLHRRRAPFSREHIGPGTINAHGQVECALRCWKPIGLLVLAGALVLEIEVERAVCVGLERHPACDRETIQAVSYLKSFRVIE